jgi:hypothetical protein
LTINEMEDEDGADRDNHKSRPSFIVNGGGFSQTGVFREAMFPVSNAKLSEEKNSNNWPTFTPEITVWLKIRI